MREINVTDIADTVARMAQEANYFCRRTCWTR